MVLQPIGDLGVVVLDELGRRHQAVVVALPRDDGQWDGFIEFRGEEGGVWVTPRETTEPDACGVLDWATNLPLGYLEGALARATDGTAELGWSMRAVALA